MSNSVKSKPSILIGLAGPAGVGKSTIADYFSLYQGYKVLSFAEPLKLSLMQLTGLNKEYFYDIKLKESLIPGLNYTPRALMQKFGTEFVREMIDYNFWIWRMRNQISEYSHKKLIIDDVRFHNEASLIRGNGGAVLHLDRNFESPTKHNEHQSEQELPILIEDYVVTGNCLPSESYQIACGCIKEFYGL